MRKSNGHSTAAIDCRYSNRSHRARQATRRRRDLKVTHIRLRHNVPDPPGHVARKAAGARVMSLMSCVRHYECSEADTQLVQM